LKLEHRYYYLYCRYSRWRILWRTGYAIKRVVKLIAVIAGLFIAGLAYLQYQQIASFDWDRIEAMASTVVGNITTQISNSEEAAAFAMSNFGIPLSGSMSAGFAVGFMKG
jgi:uncharacterized membrane protein (Fun14 family)